MAKGGVVVDMRRVMYCKGVIYLCFYCMISWLDLCLEEFDSLWHCVRIIHVFNEPVDGIELRLEGVEVRMDLLEGSAERGECLFHMFVVTDGDCWLCFEGSDAMPLRWLPIPDMYTDPGSSEMWCAAILMVQHTHVWVSVRRLGQILSHSPGAKSWSEEVLGVF